MIAFYQAWLLCRSSEAKCRSRLGKLAERIGQAKVELLRADEAGLLPHQRALAIVDELGDSYFALTQELLGGPTTIAQVAECLKRVQAAMMLYRVNTRINFQLV